MFPVEIRDFQGGHFYHLPHQGSYLNIGEKFATVGQMVDAKGWEQHFRAMIGVYYSDPTSTPEAELFSQAGFLADAEIADVDGALELLILPAGRAAVMTIKGPYDSFVPAYQWFYGEWLAQSGERPAEHPPIESYLNSPFDTAPDELLTEVHMLLA